MASRMLSGSEVEDTMHSPTFSVRSTERRPRERAGLPVSVRYASFVFGSTYVERRRRIRTGRCQLSVSVGPSRSLCRFPHLDSRKELVRTLRSSDPLTGHRHSGKSGALVRFRLFGVATVELRGRLAQAGGHSLRRLMEETMPRIHHTDVRLRSSIRRGDMGSRLEADGKACGPSTCRRSAVATARRLATGQTRSRSSRLPIAIFASSDSGGLTGTGCRGRTQCAGLDLA